MKKMRWIMLGMLVAMLLWGAGESHAQTPPQERQASQTLQRSVDGSRGTVLRSGTYAVLSLVGQPIAGHLGNHSGGIWHLQQKTKAVRSAAPMYAASEAPGAYALEANYPNPFNPNTVIRFVLPEPGRVQLSVYDMLGREVTRLADGDREAGRHSVVFEGQGLASGVYVYRLVAGSFEQHRTMLLVK